MARGVHLIKAVRACFAGAGRPASWPPLFTALCIRIAMILEVAKLDVRPGETDRFESAFSQAQAIISSMPGYISHQLQRSIESPNRYILLVNWERLEDHTVGFRQSPEYQGWKALLHAFYDPFPEVEHYHAVFGA